MSLQMKRGMKAEALASRYLEQAGYIILERNWRWDHAEIDLIAKDGDTIVIVEVKARSSTIYGYPEEAVDERKIYHLCRASEAYIEKQKLDCPLRFDIISIIFKQKQTKIKHFKDAFFPID